MGNIKGSERGQYKTPLVSNLGMITAIKKKMRLSQCPVTGGNPTRMGRATWDRMCSYHLKRSRSRKIRSAIDNDPVSKFCRRCRGQIVPNELELIDGGVNGQEQRS